ncbi:DUF5941 domain-containing protein [Kitasatospora sp. NPDC088346]|uniref:DUF5941 domain-containing protein n=1 Tax=Kitasatospora sp. NPDC088346 TaxID=3364073 RepID=UPI0037F400B2
MCRPSVHLLANLVDSPGVGAVGPGSVRGAPAPSGTLSRGAVVRNDDPPGSRSPPAGSPGRRAAPGRTAPGRHRAFTAVPAGCGPAVAVAYHHYDTVYRLRAAPGHRPGGPVRGPTGQVGRSVPAVPVAVAGCAEGSRRWVSVDTAAAHDESGDTA